MCYWRENTRRENLELTASRLVLSHSFHSLSKSPIHSKSRLSSLSNQSTLSVWLNELKCHYNDLVNKLSIIKNKTNEYVWISQVIYIPLNIYALLMLRTLGEKTLDWLLPVLFCRLFLLFASWLMSDWFLRATKKWSSTAHAQNLHRENSHKSQENVWYCLLPPTFVST